MPHFNRLTALFLTLVFSSAFAQKNPVDSLKQLFQNPKLHDTTKLFMLSTTMEVYGESDKNLPKLNAMLGDIARKKFYEETTPQLREKYASYLALYYNNQGTLAAKKRDVSNMMAYIDKSISLFKMAKMDNEMHYALISKAVALGNIQEYDKAINITFTALHFFEKDKKNNADEISYAESTLAKIYSDFDKHEESIKYNQKIIDYYRQKKDPSPQDLMIFGTSYANAAASYLALKKYPEAIANYEKALSIFVKMGDVNYKSVVLAKMAQVKIEQDKFEEAEALLKKSLEGDINPLYLANAYVKFGLLYLRKKDFAKADHYLTKGLEVSRQNNALELQQQASELLIEASRGRNDYKKALEMHELHDTLVDASKTEASKNLLAQQQLRYDFEKRELNYKLENEREKAAKYNVLTGLSAVVLLLLLGGFFYYRNNRQKQAISVLEKKQIKQKLLISQMNPHFIFNSLQNIRSLIYDKKDESAVTYLNKFSRLTRQILENSNENYISLGEEIEMTENYLAIQQLLYSNSFDFEIDVQQDLDTESIFLPPMLTQPFVENAIKHGLADRKQGGKIVVKFYLQSEKLYFEVTDNGRGFGHLQKHDNHKSMAMAITSERLANYAGSQHLTLKTENIVAADQTVLGAKVIFEIPFLCEQ